MSLLVSGSNATHVHSSLSYFDCNVTYTWPSAQATPWRGKMSNGRVFLSLQWHTCARTPPASSYSVFFWKPEVTSPPRQFWLETHMADPKINENAKKGWGDFVTTPACSYPTSENGGNVKSWPSQTHCERSPQGHNDGWTNGKPQISIDSTHRAISANTHTQQWIVRLD